MRIYYEAFCGTTCFLRTVSSDEEDSPAASVRVLLVANGCTNVHLVYARTDGYLDLSSVWNVNLDRWLQSTFVRQADYSENSFGVRGGAGLMSMRYKYTARFLPQDTVHAPNELFTSLCCAGIGTWYGNVVLCAHEPDTGESLTISWDSHTKKFNWSERLESDAKRKPRDVTLDDVSDVLHLVSG